MCAHDDLPDDVHDDMTSRPSLPPRCLSGELIGKKTVVLTFIAVRGHLRTCPEERSARHARDGSVNQLSMVKE